MRIALLASPRLRQGPMSPLLRFARDFMPFLEKHEIVTTDGCYRTFLRAGLFWAHPSFHSAGAGYEGALVRITSGVVSGAERPINVVIYLVDPRDPSSNYPETNALKRECVVHGKAFLATSRSARLWATLRWHSDSKESLTSYTISHSELPSCFCVPLSQQTVALIAHNAKKTEMLAFVDKYFDFLLSFGRRVGTGTTSGLLNGEALTELKKAEFKHEELINIESLCSSLSEKLSVAKSSGKLSPRQFVEPFQSGPEGGDVQIARLVLDGECQCIIFFEDPDVARQHEQDIQLLERTGRTRGKEVICVHDPSTASDLAQKWRPSSDFCSEPLLITAALERRFKVKAIVVEDCGNTWGAILEAASWYLLSQVAALASERKKKADFVRVTASWGVGLSELAASLPTLRSRLLQRDHTEKGRRIAMSYLGALNLGDDAYLRPGNVRVAPMQGVMAAADDAVEGNAISRAIAEFFGGEHIELSLAALLEQKEGKVGGVRSIPEEIINHWSKTDILVTTCAPVRKEHAGRVRAPGFDEHFSQVEKAACGDLGGIYLTRDGARFEPSKFRRIGMNEEQIRKVRERGGQAVLIVGAQSDREEIAFTILEAKLMSLLITNLSFARNLLMRPPLQNVKQV